MAYNELLQVGNSYNKPVKTFYLTESAGQSAQEALATLPKNIPAGSVCEYLTTGGLDVYMLLKTEENPENG